MNDLQSNTTKTREWTWMVYFAGDNNLEEYSTKDLLEIKHADSTPKVALVAQVDRILDKVTRRYFLTRSGELDKDIVELLPETNTGDLKVLLNFILWAINNYPAKHYALVLWNHGSGWKEDDIYKVAQRFGTEKSVSRGAMRGITSGKTSRVLFSTTLDQIVPEAIQRGIAYDDSDADFIDNTELKKVLHSTVAKIEQKIDILGFDACLMNMLEVVYQVRGECKVVVGSQEIEPGDGWPHDSILSCLTGKPSMPAAELGKVIVDAYINFYKQNYPNLSVTQSAIQTDRLDSLISGVNILSKALLANLDDPATLGKIYQALRYSQNFKDQDYLDLGHYCQLLTHLTQLSVH